MSNTIELIENYERKLASTSVAIRRRDKGSRTMSESSQATPAQPKRGRGAESSQATPEQTKRGRGRPRKATTA